MNVYLAGYIKADLDARTSGGRISTELNLTIEGELRDDHLKAKISGGGPELVLRTSGGDITLRRLEFCNIQVPASEGVIHSNS